MSLIWLVSFSYSYQLATTKALPVTSKEALRKEERPRWSLVVVEVVGRERTKRERERAKKEPKRGLSLSLGGGGVMVCEVEGR